MMSNLMAATTVMTPDQIPNWVVCVMGIGTVFVGLISIIILCSIMGAICKAAIKTPELKESTTKEIPNRQAMVAAISAAIAEDLGADVSAIRIRSIKRV